MESVHAKVSTIFTRSPNEIFTRFIHRTSNTAALSSSYGIVDGLMGANLVFVPIRKTDDSGGIANIRKYTMAAYSRNEASQNPYKKHAMPGAELQNRGMRTAESCINSDTNCAHSAWVPGGNGPSQSHVACHVHCMMCLTQNITGAKKPNGSKNRAINDRNLIKMPPMSRCIYLHIRCILVFL